MSRVLDEHYQALYAALEQEGYGKWLETLPEQVKQVVYDKPHGNREKWFSTLDGLPDITPSRLDLNASAVCIGEATDVDDATRDVLKAGLETYIPWRKGPFKFFGIDINTEWRSDWKWERVQPHLSDLRGRQVLDVGCGSGYHMWRMLGVGARRVIGVDPSLFFLMQFQVMRRYANNPNAYFLPLRSEDLPNLHGKGFDTVFSMGVLYHRRSPLEHLQELKAVLRQGGELVLETLVIDGDVNTALIPEDRYAKMRNVWFIPSTLMLERWLQRLGFKNIHTVDVNQTSVEEQRSTDWMRFESLKDFLDPQDASKTIEGYPAPLRAVIIADAP